MEAAEGILEAEPIAEGVPELSYRQIQIGNTFGIGVRGFRDRRASVGTYLNAASVATWDLRTAANGGGLS